MLLCGSILLRAKAGLQESPLTKAQTPAKNPGYQCGITLSCFFLVLGVVVDM